MHQDALFWNEKNPEFSGGGAEISTGPFSVIRPDPPAQLVITPNVEFFRMQY